MHEIVQEHGTTCTDDKEMMGTWDEMKPISKEKFYMVSFDPLLHPSRRMLSEHRMTWRAQDMEPFIEQRGAW